MRLIDADDFKEKIKGVCDAGGWLVPLTTICKQVDAQTTVDAVEVVRCKDCRHCVGDRCRRNAGLNDWRRNDDFCSFGERKTDV